MLLTVELRRCVERRRRSRDGSSAPRRPTSHPPEQRDPSPAEPSRTAGRQPDPRTAETSRPARPRDAPADSDTTWRSRFAREFDQICALEGRGPAPVVIESRQVPNVGASADLVVVNPEWMDRVSTEVCGDRARCRRDLVRGIAGHEWGHITRARDPSDRAEPGHPAELDADRTAGRVLARTGASVAPLVQLLQQDAAAPTETHPAGEERVEAVMAGQREGMQCAPSEGHDCCEDCAQGRDPHDHGRTAPD